MISIRYLSAGGASCSASVIVGSEPQLTAQLTDNRPRWYYQQAQHRQPLTVYLLDVAGADVLFHALPLALRLRCRFEQWAAAHHLNFFQRVGPAILDSILMHLPGGDQWVATQVNGIRHPHSGAAGVRIWRYTDAAEITALLPADRDEPNVYCVPVPLWVEWQIQRWRSIQGDAGPLQQLPEPTPRDDVDAIASAVPAAEFKPATANTDTCDHAELLIYSLGPAGSHHTLLLGNSLVFSRFLAHQTLQQALLSDSVAATLRHIHVHYAQSCFPATITVDCDYHLQGMWAVSGAPSAIAVAAPVVVPDAGQWGVPDGCEIPVTSVLTNAEPGCALPQSKSHWFRLTLRKSQPVRNVPLPQSSGEVNSRWRRFRLALAQRLRVAHVLTALLVLCGQLSMLMVRNTLERREFDQALQQLDQQRQQQLQQLDSLPLPADRLHALLALRSRSALSLTRDFPDMLQTVAQVVDAQTQLTINRIHWHEAPLRSDVEAEGAFAGARHQRTSAPTPNAGPRNSGFSVGDSRPMSEPVTVVVTIDGEYTGAESSWQHALTQLNAVKAHLGQHPAVMSVRMTRLPFGLDATATAVVMRTSVETMTEAATTHRGNPGSEDVVPLAATATGAAPAIDPQSVLTASPPDNAEAGAGYRHLTPARVPLHSRPGPVAEQKFQLQFEWAPEAVL